MCTYNILLFRDAKHVSHGKHSDGRVEHFAYVRLEHATRRPQQCTKVRVTEKNNLNDVGVTLGIVFVLDLLMTQVRKRYQHACHKAVLQELLKNGY